MLDKKCRKVNPTKVLRSPFKVSPLPDYDMRIYPTPANQLLHRLTGSQSIWNSATRKGPDSSHQYSSRVLPRSWPTLVPTIVTIQQDLESGMAFQKPSPGQSAY